MSNQTELLMAKIKADLLDYFTDELKINSDALKSYEGNSNIEYPDPKVREMRELEAIKLRDRINELHRHIAVIKRMLPTNAS